MFSPLRDWALHAAFLATVQVTLTWFNLISKEVPEPYLDEFFHVPQAQKYCRNDYSWDPKITTPPGLYLVSKALKPVLGCDVAALRFLNVIASWLIVPLSYSILRLLRTRNNVSQHRQEGDKSTKGSTPKDDLGKMLDGHSALNIALFPPLFFFSALYYTDVISTLLVLLSYNVYLRQTATSMSVSRYVQTIIVGVMALFFRQTNIFWMAVFPAGLALVSALKGSEEPTVSSGAGTASAIFRNSWSKGMIYDCPVQDAEPQDYVLFLVSLVLATMRRPALVVWVASPYVVLIALFAGFVVWNGSVVLGDKSAHTATLHVPQMLYIWPYIAFFSLPLIVGPLLRPVSSLLPARLRTAYRDSLTIPIKMLVPNVLVSIIFVLGSLVAVHYNTIIHPYTLADNRHYVFYVFRIIRRYPSIKYLAAPVYYTCAWLTIKALTSSVPSKNAAKGNRDGPVSNEVVRRPCQVSFIIVWLATTSLSVMTAPLVEPRYFIIPWIMWRLHVPYASTLSLGTRAPGKVSYDIRLILETLWLLAINGFISYTFLYRTFVWPSEPGKMQRFIW